MAIADVRVRADFLARHPLRSRVRSARFGEGELRGIGLNCAFVAFDADGPFEDNLSAAAGTRAVMFEDIEAA
jgi:hypothetical protein